MKLIAAGSFFSTRARALASISASLRGKGARQNGQSNMPLFLAATKQPLQMLFMQHVMNPEWRLTGKGIAGRRARDGIFGRNILCVDGQALPGMRTRAAWLSSLKFFTHWACPTTARVRPRDTRTLVDDEDHESRCAMKGEQALQQVRTPRPRHQPPGDLPTNLNTLAKGAVDEHAWGRGRLGRKRRRRR